jgi:hypothetical protein
MSTALTSLGPDPGFLRNGLAIIIARLTYGPRHGLPAP